MNSHLASTADLIQKATYFPSSVAFFSNFGSAWRTVQSQVLKVETRQSYVETGNVSYDLFADGCMAEAISKIPAARECDLELYSDLAARGVDFVRCRPIKFPLSDYLKWELECYKFNADHGERIYIGTGDKLIHIYEEFVLHDFMVFDQRLAFIHDYDESGEIRGGWTTTETEAIDRLISIFGTIKSLSMPLEQFLLSKNQD